MTFEVTVTASMRMQSIYKGLSPKAAHTVYDAVIETLRFAGATAAVQIYKGRRSKPNSVGTTPVIDGVSAGQSVYYPGGNIIA